jgi:hypothetical protein
MTDPSGQTQSSGRDVFFRAYKKKIVCSGKTTKCNNTTLSVITNENTFFVLKNHLSVKHSGGGGQGEYS